MESYVQPEGFARTREISPLCLWTPVTGSTQDDARAWWQETDIPSFTTLITGHQTSGRGRIGRSWQEPENSSLLATIVVNVDDTPANRHHLGWLTLIGALSARCGLEEIVRDATPGLEDSEPVGIEIKWPNDVVVHNNACSDRHRNLKIGGILGELLGIRGGKLTCAIGVGLNLTQGPLDLATPTSTSLAIAFPQAAGEDLVDPLLSRILVAFRARLADWSSAPADTRNRALVDELTAHSADLDNSITVTLADGTTFTGHARRYTDDAGLELDTLDGPVLVSTSDVAMLAAEGLE